MSQTPPRQVQAVANHKTNEKAGFMATLSAVLWSFFGVRRSDKHLQDMQNLNPIHVIVVGVMAAVVFVSTLVLIVRLVVA